MASRDTATRDILVVLLTLTTGAVDAASFLGLGKVFSSVITGNLVLLGVAVGAGGSALVERAAIALAGYSAGVLVGAPVAARRQRPGAAWGPGVTLALLAEAVVLVAFTVAWELAGGHPVGETRFALVALLAGAMGIQSAAVRRLGQMSSTYLTSTLTGVLEGLVTGGRPGGFRRGVGVLTAIVVGAACSAAVVSSAPRWEPLLVLAPLAAVIAGSLTRFSHSRAHLWPWSRA